MPVVFDPTVGGAAANSYVDLAAADAHFDNRLRSTDWTGATADDKKKALIMATTRLDQEEYVGTKTAAEQALQWPKFGAVDLNGDAYASDAMPEPMVTATAELALVMLKEDTFALSGLEGFEDLTVGPIRVKPKHPQPVGDLPAHVRREIAHLLLTRSDSSVRLFRA